VFWGNAAAASRRHGARAERRSPTWRGLRERGDAPDRRSALRNLGRRGARVSAPEKRGAKLYQAALKIGMIAIPNRDGTGRLRAQRGDWEAGRRALDCGEFSPLLSGDLSPPEAGPATKPNARLTAGASRERARSSGRSGSLDGDKSPRESGDESPHSKTRWRAVASGHRSHTIAA
jgi:hypothetical protein